MCIHIFGVFGFVGFLAFLGQTTKFLDELRVISFFILLQLGNALPDTAGTSEDYRAPVSKMKWRSFADGANCKGSLYVALRTTRKFCRFCCLWFSSSIDGALGLRVGN
jgi:hypothetical protein